MSIPYPATIVADWMTDENDEYIGVPGFVYGHWNGWTCPGFTRENAERIVAHQAAMNATMSEEDLHEYGTTFTWDGDAIIVHDYQWAAEEPDYKPERIEPNERGHYLIKGWEWTWEERDAETECWIVHLPNGDGTYSRLAGWFASYEEARAHAGEKGRCIRAA